MSRFHIISLLCELWCQWSLASRMISNYVYYANYFNFSCVSIIVDDKCHCNFFGVPYFAVPFRLVKLCPYACMSVSYAEQACCCRQLATHGRTYHQTILQKWDALLKWQYSIRHFCETLLSLIIIAKNNKRRGKYAGCEFDAATPVNAP